MFKKENAFIEYRTKETGYFCSFGFLHETIRQVIIDFLMCESYLASFCTIHTYIGLQGEI
jgi:hypothetical protein